MYPVTLRRCRRKRGGAFKARDSAKRYCPDGGYRDRNFANVGKVLTDVN